MVNSTVRPEIVCKRCGCLLFSLTSRYRSLCSDCDRKLRLDEHPTDVPFHDMIVSNLELEDGFEILGRKLAFGKAVIDVFGKDSQQRYCIVEVKSGRDGKDSIAKGRSVGRRQLLGYGEEVNRTLSWFGNMPIEFRYVLYIQVGDYREVLSWNDRETLLADIKAGPTRFEMAKFRRKDTT